jgi:hypothetical protein
VQGPGSVIIHAETGIERMADMLSLSTHSANSRRSLIGCG